MKTKSEICQNRQQTKINKTAEFSADTPNPAYTKWWLSRVNPVEGSTHWLRVTAIQISEPRLANPGHHRLTKNEVPINSIPNVNWYSCLSVCLNPPLCRGGGPHEFFLNGCRTTGWTLLKLCIAYGASFAKLLGKNSGRSGQVTELWHNKRDRLQMIF